MNIILNFNFLRKPVDRPKDPETIVDIDQADKIHTAEGNIYPEGPIVPPKLDEIYEPYPEIGNGGCNKTKGNCFI